MTYTIDAQNKTIGRVATEAASILMGKNSPDFERHIVSKNKVYITNASQVKISQKKLNQKKYKRYSGYPSGLKERALKEVIVKKGYGEVFRSAVYGMLPSNKLRKPMMKNLFIED